jgi:hypothetical protein
MYGAGCAEKDGEGVKLILTKQQRKLVSACATDDSRPVLMCLAVGKGWVAAADGFVRARMQHEYTGDTILIPASMMKHFTRCKDVTFNIGPKTISASNGRYIIVIARPAIGATFPDHETCVKGMTAKPVQGHIAMSDALFKRVLACVDGADSHVMRLFVRDPSEAMQIVAKVEPGEHGEGESVPIEVYAMPMFVDWEEPDTRRKKARA